MDRRIFFGALGAAASILTMLSLVLVLRVPAVGDAAGITHAAARPAAAEPASDSVQAGATAPQALPAVTSNKKAPVVVPEAPSKAAKASRGGGGSTSVKTKPGAGRDSRPAPPEAPAPRAPAPRVPAPSAGGDGVLVAVAVGGSCTFSVNGASKGTQSTLRVPLKPGKYAVSCKPASGSAKSRSVTVKSGETAMAMFKVK